MKTYICSNCGFTAEVDDTFGFVCPNCGKKEEEYEKSTNEIDAIIDSVLEDVMYEDKSNIINVNEKQKYISIDEDNYLICRNEDKCVNCGQCKKTCENIANIKYDLNKCKKPICTYCGECVINCPSNALSFKQTYKEVKQIIDLNEKIVVAIVDPSVYPYIDTLIEDDSEKRFVGALSTLGFDYIFNSTFAKDLSILEEVTEFAERLKNKKLLPMITSSCYSWVNYAQIYHSELLNNISTCKSPLQMHSAIIKEYFAHEKGFEESKIVTVSISNCTSVMSNEKEKYDVDYNLTLNELMILLKEEEININTVNTRNYDELLSEGSGSSYITSIVGGESESFVRTFYRIMKRSKLKEDEIDVLLLRNINGIREASIDVGEYKLRIAVVEGLANLEKLLINDKYKEYHYIEVMNCKNGCIGGCGRITNQDINKRDVYEKDRKMSKRCAHDNKETKNLYNNFLGKPLSEKCLETLHRSYKNKSNLIEEN